jgi:hypothetical protein
VLYDEATCGCCEALLPTAAAAAATVFALVLVQTFRAARADGAVVEVPEQQHFTKNNKVK